MSKFTIHQPMLFPPIYLIARFLGTSKLVLLDSDYAKKDGWHTKFKVHQKSGPVIIPAPIISRTGKRINELEFHNPERFFKKVGLTLEQAYARAPFLQSAFTVIPEASNNFSDYCVNFLRGVFSYLGEGPEILMVDYLGIERPQSASAWLAGIGVSINGTEYVCASDATEKYLDPAPFSVAGIAVVGQDYTIPDYVGVEADTSILHLLMNYSKHDCLTILKGL